jgi:hypothetical protein
MSQTTEMPEWQQNPIIHRPDGSYVIVHGGNPYHVPNQDEWTDLWATVHAYAQEHPDAVEDEPVPPPPTEDELRAAREAEFNVAISARLNEFAKEKQYDDISAARLAALSVEYAADGQAAQAAYDQTWTAAIAMWEDVVSGAIAVEQALEQLPALTWPADGE